jgi:hypothetical protein
MRKALAACAACASLALAGCGTQPPDLFEVRRSGADRNANLTLVVNDGGRVACNGAEHPLDADRLLRARELVRELAPQARLHLELPTGPGSQLAYRVRMEAGTVAFSDTSRDNPQSFLALAAFTKDVAERICGIER